MPFRIARLAGMYRALWLTGIAFVLSAGVERIVAQTADALPGTQLLVADDDLSARMVLGIDTFLLRELEQSVRGRSQFWKRDLSSPAAYDQSIRGNREHLAKCLGATSTRLPVRTLEYFSGSAGTLSVAETENYFIYSVRWPVLEGVTGEGLLLRPKTAPVARVVAIPDADQTPEALAGLSPGSPLASQFARRLAESGCEVIIPTLIDRQDTWSGNPRLKRLTNQPHREWIYRQAFEMGHHLIGYEVQKVLSAVDWFARENAAGSGSSTNAVKIGVVGYAEGGLIALNSAALDPRIDAALVSGYFAAREQVWEEPIYRNVFGLLREFGDAEIASLIAPRALFIEYSDPPRIDGPPAPRAGRTGAAPGNLTTPESYRVEEEVNRAKALVAAPVKFPLQYIHGNEGTTIGPGSDQALQAFLESLGVARGLRTGSGNAAPDRRVGFDSGERQRRQVEQLVNHTQRLLQTSDTARAEFFWQPAKPGAANDWARLCEPYRKILWNDVIGRLPKPTLPANTRTRRIKESPKWTAYDVMLDVFPEVFAWGILILPKDLLPGERRPVIVCQHGLEGLPMDTLNGPNENGYPFYKSFASQLADRGFVVFAPHNPYRGGDKFRGLQRKANPLGLSLFSFILAQHDRILDWLIEQPFVDPQRIAFYGLSYGGKTAMRIPALLNRYCLSICSADFNDWVRKNVTIDSPYSYMFMGEYELPEFNLGHTFNYAEMAALIAPRPFMVERGHDDGVAPDEWVAYEYSKVRRLYTKLGIPERTEIEFFNGPHTINGVGTFDFLHRNLSWPKR